VERREWRCKDGKFNCEDVQDNNILLPNVHAQDLKPKGKNSGPAKKLGRPRLIPLKEGEKKGKKKKSKKIVIESSTSSSEDTSESSSSEESRDNTYKKNSHKKNSTGKLKETKNSSSTVTTIIKREKKPDKFQAVQPEIHSKPKPRSTLNSLATRSAEAASVGRRPGDTTPIVRLVKRHMFATEPENPANETEVSPNNRETVVPIKKRRLVEEQGNGNKEVIDVEDENTLTQELFSKSLRLINLQNLVIQKMSDDKDAKSHSKRKPFVTDSNDLAKLDEIEYKKILHNSLKSKGISGLKFV